MGTARVCLQEFQLTLACLWGSVGLVSESYPVSIHTTASVLPLTEYKVLHMPYKTTFSIFHSPPALPSVNPTGLQSQMLWGLIFLVQVPRGSPGGTWSPHSIEGTSTVVMSLPLVGHALWVQVLSRLHL